MTKKPKTWKIGEQHHRPFPVVQLRLRPVETEKACSLQPCESAAQFGEPQRALFMGQLCGTVIPQGGFSRTQQEALMWEKAYRDQLAGKEPEPIGHLMCGQCVINNIARFLGDTDEKRASAALVASVTTGKDLILFDRNLTRDKSYPSLAMGTFETLAQFREQYWKEQGV